MLNFVLRRKKRIFCRRQFEPKVLSGQEDFIINVLMLRQAEHDFKASCTDYTYIIAFTQRPCWASKPSPSFLSKFKIING